MGRRHWTKIDFEEKSNKIHNNRYDYSKFEYINNGTKGIIICGIHGDFLQSPNKHLANRGCPICSGRILKSQNDFIKEAKEIHGERYDYSKVVYLGNKSKVEIICHLHGSFFQVPIAHINHKSGCLDCSGKRLLTNDEFIKKSNIVHNNQYDYSSSNYINGKSKINIICKYHGLFTQTALTHMSGKGCKKCNVIGGYSYSRFKRYPETKSLPAKLYLIKINDNDNVFYKIGITTKSLKTRFSNFNHRNIKLDEILLAEGELYPLFCLEQRIFRTLLNNLSPPKNINIGGGESECFQADEILIDKLKNYILYSDEVNGLISPRSSAALNLSK